MLTEESRNGGKGNDMKNARPLIGLTPSLDIAERRVWVRPAYMESVLAAGGLPVLLPLAEGEDTLREMLDRCDGILLTGGPDVEPERFGQTDTTGTVVTCPPRDEVELWLARETLTADKPLLAICRGLQVLNVVLGGDLWLDLPSQRPSAIAHRQEEIGDKATHSVHVFTDTLLQEICGENLQVNSLHHQAIRTLAPALQLIAEAEDGLAEAACLPGKRFALGVQWHPELLSAHDEASRAIFRSFVEACRAYSGKTCQAV